MRPFLAIMFATVLVGRAEVVEPVRLIPSALWTPVQSVPFPAKASPPTEYAAARLDVGKLLSRIAAEGEPAEIRLPLPDGSYTGVTVRARTAVSPEIAAAFPDLQSYSFRSADGRVSGQLSVGPGGVYFYGQAPNRLLRVEPVQTPDGVYYLSYFDCDRTETALAAALMPSR